MLSHLKYIYYYQLLQVISFYFFNSLILEIFIFAPKKTPGKHKFLKCT